MCYRFAAAPAAAQIAQWTGEATAHAIALQTTVAPLPALVHGSATPPGVPAAAPAPGPPAPGAAAAAGAAPAPAQGGAGSWLAVETRAGLRRGDAVALLPQAIVQGTRAMQEQGVPPQWVLLAFVPQGGEIEFAGAEAVGDARLMTVTTIGGQRVKAVFRAAVDAVQE
eukprot:2470107-Pyramimonas_sp.AAC.1